jgi:hypothetical protein
MAQKSPFSDQVMDVFGAADTCVEAAYWLASFAPNLATRCLRFVDLAGLVTVVRSGEKPSPAAPRISDEHRLSLEREVAESISEMATEYARLARGYRGLDRLKNSDAWDRCAALYCSGTLPEFCGKTSASSVDAVSMIAFQLMDQSQSATLTLILREPHTGIPGDLAARIRADFAALHPLDLAGVARAVPPGLEADVPGLRKHLARDQHRLLADDGFFSPTPGLEVSHKLPPGAVFRQRGSMWEITYNEVTGHFPDLNGFHDVARILRDPYPERPLSALELWGEPGDFESNADQRSFQGTMGQEEFAKARAEVIRLRGLIEKAVKNHDDAEANRLRAELQELVAQISKATTKGGAPRDLGGDRLPRRRARAIWARIQKAIADIAGATPPNPALAEHLRTSIVQKDNTFAYRPSPPAPDWALDENP